MGTPGRAAPARERLWTWEAARGVAQLRVSGSGPRTALILHGAGSGTDVAVLSLLRTRLLEHGWRVARLEQPYRVAGRRAPDRAGDLDSVALAATARLPGRLALIGRSSGARVACRISGQAPAAEAVCAIGFPLRPPGGRPDRAGELAAARVGVLIVQGQRDAFGVPAPGRTADGQPVWVHVVAGADHALATRRSDGRSAASCVVEAVTVTADWLETQIPV